MSQFRILLNDVAERMFWILKQSVCEWRPELLTIKSATWRREVWGRVI